MTNLSIAFTADSSKLEAGIAVADQSVKTFQRSVDALARTIAKAGVEATDAQRAALAGLIEKLDRAKEETAELHEQQQRLIESNLGIAGGVKAVGESLEATQAKLETFTGAFSKLGELIAVGFAGEKIAETIETFAETGDKIKHVSEETGLATENVGALKHIAAEADIQFETLAKSLGKFATATQSAMSGTGAAAEAFKRLGIGEDELRVKGNDAGAMLTLVAEKLEAMPDGFTKLATVEALFGTRQKEMLIALKQLSEEGLDGARRAVTALGGAYGEEFVEQAAKAKAELIENREITENFTKALGEDLAPALKVVTGFMRDFALASAAINHHPFFDTTQSLDQLKAKLAELEPQLAKMQATPVIGGGPLGSLAALQAAEPRAILADQIRLLKEFIEKKEQAAAAPPKPAPLVPREDLSGGEKEFVSGWEAAIAKIELAHGLFGEKLKVDELAQWEAVRKIAESNGYAEAVGKIDEKILALRNETATKGNEDQKRSLDDWFRNYSVGIENQIAAAKGNAETQAALAEQWVEMGTRLYGQDVAKFEAALKEKSSLAEAAAAEIAAKQKAAASKGLAAIDRDESTSLGIARRADHPLGDPAQAEADQERIVSAAIAAKADVLAAWLAQAAGNKQIQAEIVQDWVEANERGAEQVRQIQAEAAAQVQAQWDKINKDIAGGLSSGIMDALEGKKGGFGSAIQKWADSQIGSGIEAVLNKGLGSLEGAVGVSGNAPGALLGGGLNALGLDGVSKFLGLGTDVAKDAPLIASQTANTAALNALTLAMGGTVPALAANTTATALNSGTTVTAAGAASVGAGVTAVNTAVTGANTATQSTGLLAWVGNTAATIANTVATDAAAFAKFLGFADGGSPPVGVPSIVGERGPELFVPSTSGFILPNGVGIGSARVNSPVLDRITAGSGGDMTSAHFAQNINVHPGGSDDLASQIGRAVGQHGRAGVRALVRQLAR